MGSFLVGEEIKYTSGDIIELLRVNVANFFNQAFFGD